MSGLQIVSAVLAGLWLLVAVCGAMRGAPRAVSSIALILAVAHATAPAWPALTPVVIAAWLCFALAIPDGSLSRWRTLTAGAALLGGAVWTAVLAGDNAPIRSSVVAAVVACVVGAGAASARTRHGSPEQRRVMHWLAAGSAIAVAAVVVEIAARGLLHEPHDLVGALLASLIAIPIAQLAAFLVPGARAASVVLTEAIVAAGVAAVVAVVYLVIVVGLNGAPHGHERGVLVSSLFAALIVAVLAVPARQRLLDAAATLIGGRAESGTDVITGFGARMTRAVPMDELMLQLVESLQATIAKGGAEIWTGADGQLVRSESFPARPAARLMLGERERVVVGRARIGGPAWTTVWLPEINAAAGEADHRVVPIAHLGELLGLVVVQRGAEEGTYDEDDEVALVELARQLGLALHNVRLDSALQASLAELAERNVELQASRLRIVTAADSSRRAIERNLHDGAQQHLVALAVKIGLARSVAEEGDNETVLDLLAALREDVQTTIGELRELAHGIYPPLLRDRGLGEALRTAASRSPLPCSVEVDLTERYPEAVETAAYFCCLEAMQNAGKYAGESATITVRLTGSPTELCFELADDGAGFDVASTELGHGFQNMRDRLGAIGGELEVESKPGAGTVVRARIPVAAAQADLSS